jgi:ABC-type transport system involved in multi-copper enzyme maturation permease subunit
MKDEAQVSEKFARYDAKLTTRSKIVIGMGLRGFFSLLKLNKKGVWNLALIFLIYLWSIVFFVLMAGEGNVYPCEEMSSEFKYCQPIAYYGDMGLGGVRLFLVTLAAIASGGLIANDMNDKSLHLYLSRPISRLDYLIARFIPIFLLLIFVTVIPNMITFVTQWSNSGLEFDWIKNHKWLMFDIIVQGLFYSASYSIIGLTFSTLINREYRAAGAFFLFVYGTNIIVELFHEFVNDDRVLLLSIAHLLDIVSFKIFKAEYYFTSFGDLKGIELSNIEIFGALTIIIGGCGIFVNWMISQMEENK